MEHPVSWILTKMCRLSLTIKCDCLCSVVCYPKARTWVVSVNNTSHWKSHLWSDKERDEKLLVLKFKPSLRVQLSVTKFKMTHCCALFDNKWKLKSIHLPVTEMYVSNKSTYRCVTMTSFEREGVLLGGTPSLLRASQKCSNKVTR